MKCSLMVEYRTLRAGSGRNGNLQIDIYLDCKEHVTNQFRGWGRMRLSLIIVLWIFNVLLAPATGGLVFVVFTIVCIISGIEAISNKRW